MAVGIGIGLGRFPFETGRQYFDWVRYCEDAGIDSIWQTDRWYRRSPTLKRSRRWQPSQALPRRFDLE